MIRNDPVEIARRMSTQIGNVEINEVGFDVIENGVDDIDAVHKLAVLERHDLSGVTELDQLVRVEGVDGGELVNTREDDDGDAVSARGACDGR